MKNPDDSSTIADDRVGYPQLAREHPVPASWRRVATVMALAFSLLLAANLAARLYLNEYSGNRAYWAIAAAWDRLDAMEEPVDWLLLGDSGCALGIVPQVMERELGGSALSLCTVNRLAALDDALLLDRAIERGLAPRAVVVTHVPAVWQLEALPAAVSQVPHALWVQRHPLVRGTFTVGERAGILARRFLPLYSEDRTLRGLLFAPGTWFRAPFEVSPKGHMSAPRAFPERVRETAATMVADSARSRFQLSEGNRRALVHLLRRAAEQGVTVFVATSPMYEGMVEAAGYRQYLESMESELGGLMAAFPDAVLLPRIRTYPAEAMENPVHLLPEAAAAFTRDLADEIRGQAIRGAVR